MKNLLIATTLFTSCIAYSQCNFDQATFDVIAAKYQNDFTTLEKRSQDIADDAPDPNIVEAPVDITFKIEMVRKDFSCNIPQITMKDKKLSFDTPQVTMKLKSIKFKKPVTKMVIKKTGQYPVIEGWTIKWKDIKTSVPEVTMEEQEIKTKIPEIKVETTNIITAIPEIKMVKKDMSLNVPSVTVKKISAEVKKIEDRAKGVSLESEKLQESQNDEFAQAIHKSFECQRTDLIVSRTNLENEFSTSVSEIENSIAQLRSNGLNPESIKGDQGEDINLIAIRDELLLKKKEAFEQIDAAIEKMNTEEKNAINMLAKKIEA
jgi:hypothetical protein